MAGELTSRCVADARPPRASLQQHHLLHSMKTDEIEILESGGGTGGGGSGGVNGSGGIGTHRGSKVSYNIHKLFHFIAFYCIVWTMDIGHTR